MYGSWCMGLGCIGLQCAGLGCVGLGFVGLRCVGFRCIDVRHIGVGCGSAISVAEYKVSQDSLAVMLNPRVVVALVSSAAQRQEEEMVRGGPALPQAWSCPAKILPHTFLAALSLAELQSRKQLLSAASQPVVDDTRTQLRQSFHCSVPGWPNHDISSHSSRSSTAAQQHIYTHLISPSIIFQNGPQEEG